MHTTSHLDNRRDHTSCYPPFSFKSFSTALEVTVYNAFVRPISTFLLKQSLLFSLGSLVLVFKQQRHKLT